MLPKDVETPAATRHDRDHRTTQLGFQLLQVDLDGRAFGQIHHVERRYCGQTQLQHLTRQIQVALQGRRIEQQNDALGLGLLRPLSEQHLPGQALFRRDGSQTVQARQVEQSNPVLGQPRVTDPAFDRRAWKVRGLGPQTGQSVEERRLAGVRVANQGDADLVGIGRLLAWG